MTDSQVTLRDAEHGDIPLIVALTRELAEYEKLADICVVDERKVEEMIFSPDPVASVVLAFVGSEPAGYALFFRNYSTFLARPGIYLEDLYVRPSLRGRGVGLLLLKHLARRAVEREYGRVEWSVLRWNRLAIDFYEKIGAEAMEGWVTYRLSGDPLRTLAES